MSAPALPEAFGNYALGDFVELVSPEAISWLPQTVGWWWLGAALLAAAGYYGARRLRHWFRNRYRREAAERLQRLAGAVNPTDQVADINRLLKLTALVAYSREQVACLSGQDWVEFLNRQCQQPPFNNQQAKLLAVGPYAIGTVDAGAVRQLLAASLTWVHSHQSAADA